MTILLTGGTGKTSIRVARLLQDADIPVLLASRSNSAPPPYRSCRFDWLDNRTYSNPFLEISEITAIYLVAPAGHLDVLPAMKPFIDFAKSKGVQRFVLLSASDLPAGGHFLGKVHEYLISLRVEFAVLRPTWFMENFSEGQHLQIRQQSRIYSASGEGKAPFVSAEDIAAVAFRALVDKPSHNTDYIILGPELLSYDDVADILSKVLNRKITHIKISESELAATMHSRGMPEEYAKMLASLDTQLANGVETRLNDVVKEAIGREPKAFSTFAEENKSCWVE